MKELGLLDTLHQETIRVSMTTPTITIRSWIDIRM